MRLPLLLRRPTASPQVRARGAPFGARVPEPACRYCLDSGRVPYTDNHFAVWMVPCEACRPRTRGGQGREGVAGG